MTNEEIICLKVAGDYAGKNWHEMRSIDHQIIADLEKAGWLGTKKEHDGFVGELIINVEPILCDLCAHDFGVDYKSIYHFSGILNSKSTGHIHVCPKCVDKIGLPVSVNFDVFRQI